ncbi:aminotransferase class III-fold pyridoxal phosphate-dependent enzyme [Streptomyces sp. NPDC057253]|uniref:aminotransferase class III-fold pyridoxal phosphate-dependent enzyme n=1 Tax=Streptomyces sp. NPDC057253 TaxID=3346069 RepID=UPI0036364649
MVNHFRHRALPLLAKHVCHTQVLFWTYEIKYAHAMVLAASDLETSAVLSARASQVIPGPGGMYGHLSKGVNRLTPNFPQFYERGLGATVWDVDGRPILDAMCAWGPMVLGYADQGVIAAQERQLRLGDTLNGPSPLMVELAELLVDTVDHADWALFAKNGNDATASAVRIARAATGRSKLLKARKAYHGASDAFTPIPVGVAPGDRQNIIEFDYNDLNSLEAAAEAHAGDVAAIIVTPHQHDGIVPQAGVDPSFARGVRALCDRTGAVLILDEVRTAMRIDLRGAWTPLGVAPDITCVSKSIGNGAAISAVLGVDSLKEAAGSIYVTGSFWFSAAPMAAAIETVTRLRDNDGIAAMVAAGTRLREGLQTAAADQGVGILQTGPVQMPLLTFDDDPELSKAFLFASVALDHGAYFHPWHNWFMSTAHTPEVIDAMVAAAVPAFTAVAEEHS